MQNTIEKLATDGSPIALMLMVVLLAIDKGWILVRRVTGTSLEGVDKKVGHIEAVGCQMAQRQQEQCLPSIRATMESANRQTELLQKMLTHLEIMSQNSRRT